MITALLFDLDGTLLNLDMDQFLNYYFKAMTDYAVEWGLQSDQPLMEQVWKSTEAMIANLDPGRSNEEVFMQSFIPHFDYAEEHVREFFDSFYLTRFPQLQQYCSALPRVPEILDQAFSRGYTIAIATNPVFPKTATEQRLEWAGISSYPFKLVTTYENMHFCKPQIQYYQEISAIIGVPPTSCLMIGNDTREDLVAGKIGMKTFLLKDGLLDRGDGYPADWEGFIDELERFISALPVL